MRSSTSMLVTAAAALLATTASAAPIVLTFEGVGNQQPVGNFYASQGITFSPSTLALIDGDAGGTGNFANEPSANTVMFFLDDNDAILNYAAGFTTGFSFFYSSGVAASVRVFDGVNGTGNLLASLNLASQFNGNGCVGDPSGFFCNWTAVGVTFAGTARSINFGGTAASTGFDDITFGSATAGDPGGPVVPAIPEPSSWAMLIAGFGLIGATLRRRRAALAA